MRFVFAATLTLSISLITACQPASPPTARQTTFQLAELYATTPVPSRTPRPTTTPTPSPSLIPGWDYDTPVSNEPPWLIHRHAELGIFLTNMDGTGFRQIQVPETYDYEPYFGPRLSDISPSKKMIALINSFGMSIENEILGIASLITGELIFETPVAGEMARNKLRDDGFSAFKEALYWAKFIWSPDGKYLAFVGALDGISTEIYVYDVAENAVKRLSNTPEEVVILGWSPDSQEIIFYTITKFGTQRRSIKDIMSVGVEGKLNFLYSLNKTVNSYSISGWIGDNEFIGVQVADYENEKFTDEIAIINTRKPSVEIIFEGDVGSVIYNDSQYPRLFITFGNPVYPKDDEPFSTYEFNFETDEWVMFLPNQILYDYIGGLDYYATYEGDTGNPYLNIYNSKGDFLFSQQAPWHAVVAWFYVPSHKKYVYIFSIQVSVHSRDGKFSKELRSMKVGGYYFNDDKIYFSETIDDDEIIVFYEIVPENDWEMIEVARFPATTFSIISP